MNLQKLFTINVPISAFFGFACILFPRWLFSLYGADLTPPGLMMTQLAGAAYIGFGTLALQARSSSSKEFRLALALGLFMQDIIAVGISIYGQVAGIFNAFGWSTVAVYLFLALGYGYFRFVNTENA